MPISSQSPLKYRNVMELLAAEEIERQLQRHPDENARTIDRAEAISYALNRLPSLYATTEEGWCWQRERAEQTLSDLISMAAGWGIREARYKNKRFTTPLPPASEAEKALQTLKEMLGYEDLSWDNVVTVVEQRLKSRAASSAISCPVPEREIWGR
ncbi:late competence development ComFB family protein [Oscillatoriales cyanobacterium LEGE 11467]|uniref:Late competence development ComFB family protein n=1 Tax=Zarconia navalis LEGE 11467 TaxID=1828826 RepID=A0A928W097_9CYAN|nr:late competence development ComFB family protein [Zarconia navalis]MBE9040920.1 late competence development ComFB family protein [Zarconia navalis LEGE 11467]